MENPIDQTQTPSLQTPPVPPESTPLPPVQPIPAHQNKNILQIAVIVLAIALLAMAGIVFYLLQKQAKSVTSEVQPSSSPTVQAVVSPQPTDETANWKTVSNKLWTFKVPPNLNYVECNSQAFDQILVGSSNASSGLFDKDKVIECNFDQTGAIFTIFRGMDNSENTIGVPTNTDPKLDPVVSHSQVITVDGKKATFQQETTSMGQGTGTRYKVYIHQSNYTDEITFEDIKQKNLFNQILSTFKFTPQMQVSLTHNDRCGFSVQLPDRWKMNSTVTIAAPATSCVSLEAPDFVQQEENATGLSLWINKIPIGSVLRNTSITSLDSYISSVEKIQDPVVPVDNLKAKTIGIYSGKSYDYSAARTTTSFIFQAGNSIYEVSWDTLYDGQYKGDIEKIIASLVIDK